MTCEHCGGSGMVCSRCGDTHRPQSCCWDAEEPPEFTECPDCAGEGNIQTSN